MTLADRSMIQFHSLEKPSLEPFLERNRAAFNLKAEIDLDVVLRRILEKAFEFVPSESGSILLDDPRTKKPQRQEHELVFLAAFGTASQGLMGQKLSAHDGIAGRVYQTGTPYLSPNVNKDKFFFSKIDEEIGHKTESIVCVPIYIGKEVCGVLELINRIDQGPFTERDMTLLEIFAGYTSFTVQNALDAKRAHELAKKDDLTGLFNDRWFHVRLTDILLDAQVDGHECVLLFMDLDNFKAVNDCHGHLAGSQVLRETGKLLREIVNREDAILSRYGGDEFVMILPNTSLEVGKQIAEAIRAAIEENSFLGSRYLYGVKETNLAKLVTASIGVAAYDPSDETDAHDAHMTDIDKLENQKSSLLKRADTAMYEAKALGKNRVAISIAGQAVTSD